MQPMAIIKGHAYEGFVNHSLKINWKVSSLKLLNWPFPVKIKNKILKVYYVKKGISFIDVLFIKK